jgi:hypothetical protein
MRDDPRVNIPWCQVGSHPAAKVYFDRTEMCLGRTKTLRLVGLVPDECPVDHDSKCLPLPAQVGRQLDPGSDLRLALLVEGNGVRLPANLLPLLLPISKVPYPPDSRARDFLKDPTGFGFFLLLCSILGCGCHEARYTSTDPLKDTRTSLEIPKVP